MVVNDNFTIFIGKGEKKMGEGLIRVSNIEIFESISKQPRYKARKDLFEGVEILSRNSRDGLCPHQHFQEDKPVIDNLFCLQEDLPFSIRMCH